MSSSHFLSSDLDVRLLAYANASWNGQEAVYSFQQFTTLLPIFESNLKAMYGGYGIGDARRGWGVAADLVAAMTGLSPTMASLRSLGYASALNVGYLIPYTGRFALAESVAARNLNISTTDLADDALVLFARADAHARIGKPMLQALRDEMRSYDASDEQTGSIGFSFRKLALAAGGEPQDFPDWDGRPLFLHEQKAFLDFLAKKIALEIVANNLVDETLGRAVATDANLIERSEVANEEIWNIDTVPNALLRKPVELVFSHIGQTILRTLRAHDPEAAPLDRLFVVETAVKTEVGLDITKALEPTRNRLVEEALTDFLTPVVDIRDSMTTAQFIKSFGNSNLPGFDFPDLEKGA